MVTNDTCDPCSAGVVQVLDVSYGFASFSSFLDVSYGFASFSSYLFPLDIQTMFFGPKDGHKN
jgi:hypothetical protein